jgi:hypothetical protein
MGRQLQGRRREEEKDVGKHVWGHGASMVRKKNLPQRQPATRITGGRIFWWRSVMVFAEFQRH